MMILTIIGVLGLLFALIAIPKENKKDIKKFLLKQGLKIFPVSFNIAISIEFQEGLNSGQYYRELMKQLNQMIIDNKLEKMVKIKDCSDIIKFNTKEEAESFLKEKGLSLIIWGSFSTDNLKQDGENKNTLNVNFTYDCIENIRARQCLLLDIQSKFVEKNYWTIIEKNSFDDIQIISDNIKTLSLYTLGVSLKVLGKIGKSIFVLEKLHKLLITKNDVFQKHTTFHLINNYGIIVIDSIFNGRISKIGIDCANKILDLDPNNHNAISNLAFLYYNAGDVMKSQEMVTILNRLYPNSQVTKLDNAFFKIQNKSYSSAYKLYEDIREFDMNNLIFNPLMTIEFLGLEYEKTKEPAFLYASGILSYYFGDRKLAEKDFRQFLQKTENRFGYSKMQKRSIKLFNKIK